jgi:hypothetical protein
MIIIKLHKGIQQKINKKYITGQGLVETALILPVLLIVLTGLLEFGFLLNDYLTIQDAARNAARFASDGLYYSTDSNQDCVGSNSTVDFNRQTACLVERELAHERPEITLQYGTGDDIVVSSFSIVGGAGGGTPTVSARYPDSDGWSRAHDLGQGNTQVSKFDNDWVISKLNSSAPSTGLVLVEIYFNYEQKLALPWITVFIDNPLLMHNYAIMPLVSAEPTPVYED